uniref:Uncharacterized protein n=1 Tax=Zosterops lateralis melanops TaxID=1220523 RepID=A0A8D2NYQ1_ZOSLA
VDCFKDGIWGIEGRRHCRSLVTGACQAADSFTCGEQKKAFTPDSTSCSKGWRRFQGNCYFLSSDTMSWAESEQNCTGMGSQLVVINSEAEQVCAQG